MARAKVAEPARPPKWPWVLLGLALLFSAVVRIRLLQIPLERDEGEFAYMGQLMLHGIPPYKIAFNMKMPGIYAAYALIMRVFGQTTGGIHFGFMLTNLLTIVLVFMLTRRLFGLVAASGAAAGYSILSIYPTLLGTQAHATHFVIAFALGGMLLTFRAIEQKRKWIYLVAGALFGISFLMKQPGGLFGVLAFGYCLWDELKHHSPGAISRLGLLIAGGLAPLAITVGLLWRAGVLNSFYFWTFTYLRTYAMQVPLPLAPLMLRANTPTAIAGAWPIFLPALLGLVLVCIRPHLRSNRAFMLAFLVTSFLAVCPGFYFRPHYYVLVLPSAAMLGGIALSEALHFVGTPDSLGGRGLLPAALFAVALVSPIQAEKDFFFTYSVTQASRRMYGGNPFVEAVDVAKYIKSHTTPKDTIAVLGSEPEIYFYADRRAAVSYIYMYPLMEIIPFARQMQQQFIEQVESNRPKYIVFVGTKTSWLRHEESDKSIDDWAADYLFGHYEPVGLVESLGENWTVSYWDDEAEDMRPRGEYYVSVFLRKAH